MKTLNQILIGLWQHINAGTASLLSAGSGAMLLLTVPFPACGAPNEPVRPVGKSAAIPLDQLGAVAGKQYSGDGLAVNCTARGARLRCVFQKLEGEASSEGLWLTSTASGEKPSSVNSAQSTDRPPERFRLKAVALGRAFSAPSSLKALPSTTLPPNGTVSVVANLVRFFRPGMIEEYSTGMDGVRQDFVVADRPAGEGELQVRLEVVGARVERAPGGAQLVLEPSRRKLAYSQLRATDARGRELPARIEVLPRDGRDAFHRVPDLSCLSKDGDAVERVPTGGEMAVVVNDAEAVYPVRIDPTFSDANWISLGGIPGVNGTAYAMVTDGSSNLYVGGSFTVAGTVLANNIAKWDGRSWSALGSGVDGEVHALAVAGSDLYAGGSLTNAGGISVTNIAKWDGTNWSALGTGVDGEVRALAVSGSDLYAGGSFTNAGGIAADCIAKWDGGSWSPLGSGVRGSVQALAVSGSYLYVGGSFAYAGGIVATNIAKWDGSGWFALGSGMAETVFSLALSDGALFAGTGGVEWDWMLGGSTYGYVNKWDGSTWSAVGPELDVEVFALAVLGNDVYAGGGGAVYPMVQGYSYGYLAKLDGSSWSVLGKEEVGVPDSGLSVKAVELSGGNLYAGGRFNLGLAKWDGSSWSALGPGLSLGLVAALAVSDSGVYAGAAGDWSHWRYGYVAKWDGSSWSALGSGMSNHTGPYVLVSALAVSGSNVYAGGLFETAGGIAAANISKWDGTSWSALGSGVGEVYALAVSGSILYVGGWSFIAKWDGSSWSALGSGVDGPVYALAVSGSNIYAGGHFATAGGIPATNVAKWDGSRWSALGSGLNGPTDHPYYGGSVSALAVSGSNLYASGSFTTAGGMAATNLAKWDGSTWSALGFGLNGPSVFPDSGVSALAVSGSNLYAGGSFTNAGGIAANFIAKWDGSSWSALGSGVNAPVSALAVWDSELFAGGSFTTAGGKVSGYAAKAIINPGNWLKLQLSFPGPHTNTLTYVGVPNAPSLIQWATNLTSSPWFTLATNTPTANGRGTVQDPAATDPQRFYRIVEP